MFRQLARELDDEQVLARNARVVVGVSGGPDSVALLHALHGLNEFERWSLKLHVAHLHHGIRGVEADQDAAFVRDLSERLGTPCTTEQRDIPALATERGLSLEETSRQERYAFFTRVCLQTNAEAVALGHHADDNAETILHRVIRGTGLRGLAGIPRSRPIAPGSPIRVVRPLLRWRKSQILEFLQNLGASYRQDASNVSGEMMRNRIRHTVLPLLEAQINPQAREALIRLGEQAQWLEEFLRETVQRTFETLIISRNDRELILNVDVLARKSRIVQTELIRLGYRSFGLGEQDLSFGHLVAALDLVADPESGRRTILPNGLILERRYHQLIFSLPTDVPRETIAEEVAISVPGTTVLPVRRLKLECTVLEATPEDIPKLRRLGGPMLEHVDLDAVRLPLVVRTRRPGDRFFPLGAPGSKKVNDFLASAKVDPKQRERVAVLCDHLGPIWIIGFRIDERVKLTPQTRRVLRLRATAL